MASEINITPLVDIVLVLLIIFMVLSPLSQSGYDVAMPRIGPPGPSSHIVVELYRRESVLLNKEEVRSSDLQAKLAKLFGKRKDRTVLFAASDEINYGLVTRTLDTIRTAGAERIAITTKDAK